MPSCPFCFQEFHAIGLSSHIKFCRYNPNFVRKWPDWIYELDDDRKLYSKYLNKRNNAKHEGLECKLSFIEYCELVRSAGLHSSDLGFHGKMFVLARINDSGDYTVGNCRFITQSENAQERKVTEDVRISARMRIQNLNTDIAKAHRRATQLNPESEFYKYNQKRRNKALERQEELRSKLDSRYTGERNSQFGTFWITNGIDNKKWRDDKGNIPDGYRRGRI